MSLSPSRGKKINIAGVQVLKYSANKSRRKCKNAILMRTATSGAKIPSRSMLAHPAFYPSIPLL